MSVTTTAVSQEEVARRVDEYRRICWERRLPAQVVYSPPYLSCPWAGCQFRIAGIRFNIEEWVQADELEHLVKQWWLGPGLVARCPGCGNLVLFGVTSKTKSTVPAPASQLPDDWDRKAHVVLAKSATE